MAAYPKEHRWIRIKHESGYTTIDREKVTHVVQSHWMIYIYVVGNPVPISFHDRDYKIAGEFDWEMLHEGVQVSASPHAGHYKS